MNSSTKTPMILTGAFGATTVVGLLMSRSGNPILKSFGGIISVVGIIGTGIWLYKLVTTTVTEKTES